MAIFGVQLALLAGLAVLVTLAVLVWVLEAALDGAASQRRPLLLVISASRGGQNATLRPVAAELLASTPSRAPPPMSLRARPVRWAPAHHSSNGGPTPTFWEQAGGL